MSEKLILYSDVKLYTYIKYKIINTQPDDIKNICLFVCYIIILFKGVLCLSNEFHKNYYFKLKVVRNIFVKDLIFSALTTTKAFTRTLILYYYFLDINELITFYF